VDEVIEKSPAFEARLGISGQGRDYIIGSKEITQFDSID